jgi:hypothetical protein
MDKRIHQLLRHAEVQPRALRCEVHVDPLSMARAADAKQWLHGRNVDVAEIAEDDVADLISVKETYDHTCDISRGCTVALLADVLSHLA